MYEGLPGEVKTFSVRGMMFPNEEESSSTSVPRARRLREVLLTLRHRPPLGDSRLLLFLGGSPPRSGFFVIGVFLLFIPPPRPAGGRTTVRIKDAIAGWVVRERKHTTTTRCTGWRAHGRRTCRRLSFRNRQGSRRPGRD